LEVEVMRTFFGIPCPEHSREPLTSLQKELSQSTNLSPVSPNNFHLTVKFLGETSTSDVEDLDSLLQSRLPTPGPLELTLEGVGVFPSMDHPSVAWAGIEPIEPLMELHRTVEAVSTELGFDPGDHDFRPHVTLGRYRNSVDGKNSLLEWIQTHGNEQFESFEASNLHLYESELKEDGPIYTSIVSWPL